MGQVAIDPVFRHSAHPTQRGLELQVRDIGQMTLAQEPLPEIPGDLKALLEEKS